MKTPHPYAEILRAIADGETVQVRRGPDFPWADEDPLVTFSLLADESIWSPKAYRIKPRTIRVGEVEVTPPRGVVGYSIAENIGDAKQERILVPSDFKGGPVINVCMEFDKYADAETAGRAIAALFAKDKS